MITKSNFFIIIILVLIGVIVVQQCTSDSGTDKPTVTVDGKKYELLKHKIDTVIVDHFKTKYVKGKDIYHETIIEKEKEVKVPVYVKGDTIRIVEDYHKKVLYKDKLVLDNDLGLIEVTDTISMNKIIGRKWNAQIKERTITDTKIVKELPKNQVYVGVGGIAGNSLDASRKSPPVVFEIEFDDVTLNATPLLIPDTKEIAPPRPLSDKLSLGSLAVAVHVLLPLD